MNDNVQKLSFPSLMHNFVRTKGADLQQNMPKKMQGHISKILENDFLEFTIDATGPYTLPVVKLAQAFSKYHREPTQVGDKGYYVPGDFYIGGETGDGGGTANMYPRGNLSNGVFHPVSAKNFDTRDPNMFLVTGGPSGHTTQTQDKTTSMVLDHLNNIIHTSSKDILHNALENIQHIAKQNIQHIAEQAISHIAGNSMTHAVLNGVINHVAQSFTFGAPQAGTPFDLETPPIPTLPSIMNVIGSMTASLSISVPASILGAGGSITAAGVSSGGAPVMTAPVPPQLVNSPQNVTGAKGGNTALASLLTALVTLGLITDNTTA